MHDNHTNQLIRITEREKPDGSKETEYELRPSKSGALAGAAAGATVGSIVPVIGTAIGGAIGGAIGFLFGPAD